MSQFSVNNRVVVEAYKTDKSLRSNVSNGFATVAQKTGLVGLRVIMDAHVTHGMTHISIAAGATVYIREEILHTAAWAAKALSCDTISTPFMIVDVAQIEFVSNPEYPAA